MLNQITYNKVNIHLIRRLMMAKYIITERTMYIKSHFEQKQHLSLVGEFNETPFIVEERPLSIIETSCVFYHSSYNNRKLATKLIANITTKPPIVVDPGCNAYFFPTHSDRSKEQSWINLQYVDYYKEGEFLDTIVYFDDKSNISVPISKYVFNSQFINTIKLEYSLRTKLKKQDRLHKRNIDEQMNPKLIEILSMYSLLS